MKKITQILVVLVLIIPSISLAHPGNTDSSGCHTCRTNCSSWGLYTGEYHCHNNKGFTQPEYPIHSTYGSGGTGYTTPAPDYAYPSYYPTTPSCPSNSYASGDSCKCYSGYIVSGSSCVSASLYCSSKIGLMSRYDSLSKTCECMYGYKIDSSGQCVSQQSYCTNTFGYGAEYSYLESDCVCKTGYKVNTTTNRCVLDTSFYVPPITKSCPLNSYSLGDSCYCSTGYELNKDKTGCIIKPTVKTNEQICQDSFGINSIWDGTYSASNGMLNCNCKTGYQWNSERTACIIKEVTISAVAPNINNEGCFESNGQWFNATTGAFCGTSISGCTSSKNFSATTKISCDGTNKCSSGLQLNNDKTECILILPKVEVNNNQEGTVLKDSKNDIVKIIKDEVKPKQITASAINSIPESSLDKETKKPSLLKRFFSWLFK